MAEKCRFLEEHPVPVCKAFTGGLRTPLDHELEELCSSGKHALCPWFASATGKAKDASDGKAPETAS